jgi:hypothetical protein
VTWSRFIVIVIVIAASIAAGIDAQSGQTAAVAERIASLDFDDPAWERLATPIYEDGIARQDLPYTIDTLSRAAGATTNPASRSSILLVLGEARNGRAIDLAALRGRPVVLVFWSTT